MSGTTVGGGFHFLYTTEEGIEYVFQKEVYCSEAAPGQTPNSKEIRAQFEAMRRTSDFYPYALVDVYQGQGTDQKNKKKKMEEDRIATYGCTEKNCPVKHIVLRRKKWIAAYTIRKTEVKKVLFGDIHQNHEKPSADMTGLCMEAKRFANEMYPSNPMDVFRIIMSQSEAKRKQYFANDPATFRLQLIDYYRNMDTQMWLLFPNSSK